MTEIEDLTEYIIHTVEVGQLVDLPGRGKYVAAEGDACEDCALWPNCPFEQTDLSWLPCESNGNHDSIVFKRPEYVVENL